MRIALDTNILADLYSTDERFTMKKMKVMKKGFDDFSYTVIRAAIKFHRHLGQGLLESTYQQCLARELRLNHIEFKMEYPLPMAYKVIRLDWIVGIESLCL